MEHTQDRAMSLVGTPYYLRYALSYPALKLVAMRGTQENQIFGL